MKLVLNFQEAVALFHDEPKFDEVVAFAVKEFGLERQGVSLSFLDEEGDNITIISDEDVQVMLAVCEGKEYLKISVEGTVCPPPPQEKEQEPQMQPEMKEEPKAEKVEAMEEEKPAERGEGERRRCGGMFRMWGKLEEYINLNVSKMVDERLQAMVPVLREQVQRGSDIRPIQESSIEHQGYECKGCQASPITGVRYECLKCPNFSLCSQCEEKIDHEHNMLKVKRPVNKEEEKSDFANFFSKCGGQEKQWGPWSKKPEGSGCWWKRRHEDSEPKHAQTLAYMFGGEGKDYEQFVKENHELRPVEIFKKYAEAQNVTGEDFTKKLVDMRCLKLAMTFNKPTETYQRLVSDNLDLPYPKLVKTLCKRGLESEPKEYWWAIVKSQEKGEEKKEKKKEESVMKTEVSEVVVEKKEEATAISGEINEIHNEVLDQMIDLFGADNIREYEDFIVKNRRESPEKLIELWLAHLTQK